MYLPFYLFLFVLSVSFIFLFLLFFGLVEYISLSHFHPIWFSCKFLYYFGDYPRAVFLITIFIIILRHYLPLLLSFFSWEKYHAWHDITNDLMQKEIWEFGYPLLSHCYWLNCVPPKFVYWSPNTQYLKMWLYFEIWSLKRW